MSRAPLWALGIVVAVTACGSGDDAPGVARQPGTEVPRPADVRPTPAPPARYAIGREARPDEIRAWDIDVNADGRGLPPGRGTYARGAVVYAQQCASCHGPAGEGMAGQPRLVGAEPPDFRFAADPKLPKTVGNYWPHATTLYDYINRAMPFNAPGTLSAGDVYSVVAWVLAKNGIVDSGVVMDADALRSVRMPARDRFVRDDRQGGPGFR